MDIIGQLSWMICEGTNQHTAMIVSDTEWFWLTWMTCL